MRFIITLLLVTNFLSAGDKIALLIGNNDYSFQPLANPLNDVDGIYKTLREIGFEKSDIKVLKNVSKTKMETALANFSQKASSAEIALVYFSGHGIQVNNTNYMFPANTTATKPIHLRTLVDLDYFIESASSAKYGIILVDACRNNPLIKYFQNGKYKGSTAKKGLGQVTPTAGQVVIGFATSAGDTADDGKGNMSPYARALSERLKESDDIRNVLGKVAQDVSGRYEQNPIYRANLASSVFLSRIKTIKEVKEKISHKEMKNENNRLALKTISKHSLTISPSPSSANIYILNIKPKYRDKIILEEGVYQIKVKKNGYKTEIFEINLTKNIDYKVTLKEDAKPINIKWFRPNKDICLKNEGIIVDYTKECRASWKNAKEICVKSGGLLPTYKMFEKLITDCGGTFNAKDRGINQRNNQYHSCYLKKGIASHWSWTLDSYQEDNSKAFNVRLYYGWSYAHKKREKNGVVCVKMTE